MRGILYRAKTRDGKEWLEGYYVKLNDKAVIVLKEATDRFDWERKEMLKSHDMILVDSSTVCQYTGLTDKNGRKIFEGDILCNHYDEVFPQEKTFSSIVWDGFKLGIKSRNVIDSLDEFDCKNGEVIGNIFDNPELMGE